MTQTKTQSAIESVANVAIGYGVSLAANATILPLFSELLSARQTIWPSAPSIQQSALCAAIACAGHLTGGYHMQCIDQESGDGWTLINGDCVESLKGLPDHSIDYSIFSPPFAKPSIPTATARDMGNCQSDEEFFEHFGYLIAELLRVMRPGHNVSFTAC